MTSSLTFCRLADSELVDEAVSGSLIWNDLVKKKGERGKKREEVGEREEEKKQETRGK